MQETTFAEKINDISYEGVEKVLEIISDIDFSKELKLYLKAAKKELLIRGDNRLKVLCGGV